MFVVREIRRGSNETAEDAVGGSDGREEQGDGEDPLGGERGIVSGFLFRETKPLEMKEIKRKYRFKVGFVGLEIQS